LVEDLMRRFPKRSRMQNAPEAQTELHYLDSSAITLEIDRFQRAAKDSGAFGESFMTAPSPGIISTTMLNAYYDSQQAYLIALAREMRNEYLAIHHAGLLLQIDAPDLAMDRSMFYRDLPDREFVKAAEMHISALNQAIDGIPRDRVRLHCCWGNWNGPHLYDVSLDLILPVLYQANVGALSIEFGNPRHQHELEALRRHKLPDRMLLLPGVVESNSNIVEHPEVVARRLEEAVAVVGDRERVIASADCGFGTFTNREYVIEPVVWLKLRSLRQGADIASSRLWG
jgi:5-methyltetrahydropteroyltriglutamate--homocysteine methyltransferase